MTASISSANGVTFSKSTGHETMRRNGRSFWFASLFLPRDVSHGAARLYAFCRVMDDLADEGKTPETAIHLEQVRYDLLRGSSNTPQVADLLALAQRYPLPSEAVDHLIASFVADASKGMLVETEAELIRYCFGVAGTVGLLMAPILGAISPMARSFAADLGIAMQMTNIARDVAEDARNGRRYLPGDWIAGMTPAEIVSAKSGPANVAVSRGIARLLDLADCFYARACGGFPLIPTQSRRAIEVAATVYREIGVQLRRRCSQENRLTWQPERTVVPTARKVRLACAVFAGVSPLVRLPKADLPAESLAALHDLPGLP